MKTLNMLVGAVLSSLVFHAMADDSVRDTTNTGDTQEYNYSMNLDIAKVISISSVPDVCEVVPAKMVYEDSAGHRHTLIYRVMGNGCSHG